MWILLALAASICFAVVYLLDEYCIDEVLDKPWMAVITSATASIIVFLPLPYILPFINWQWPPAKIIALGIFSGMLIQVSQLLYYNALAKTNAGIVATYLNLTTAILPIVSFILFGTVLTPYQYIGIILLIFASNTMLLADHNYETRTSALFLTIGVSLIQTAVYLIQDYIYEITSFIVSYFLLTVGLMSVGIFACCLRPIRQKMYEEKNKILSSFKLFFGIGCLDLFAIAFAQKSIQIGHPSLVSAIETTIPGFTFIITFCAISIFGIKYDEKIFSGIGKKFASLSMMIMGVYLVS
ncbi:MAG: EamA-like transporter family [Candidatus Peregrinibacteria bacterium Greene1014_49]|nr:MAG: EamA-like transporter family [Candidatus Peregrinibacteria bacterium Greene1014_49]